MRAEFPASPHGRLELSLYRVEVGRYAFLDLADITWPHWVVSFIQQGQVETATRGVRSGAADGDAIIHPPRPPVTCAPLPWRPICWPPSWTAGRRRAVRRARQLLESTDDTLDSIAHACGLGDAAAFSRAFRSRYGAAPGQHRQSAKRTRQSVLYPLEEIPRR